MPNSQNTTVPMLLSFQSGLQWFQSEWQSQLGLAITEGSQLGSAYTDRAMCPPVSNWSASWQPCWPD